MVEEELGHVARSAVTRAPQRPRHVVGCRRAAIGEVGPYAIEQPERSGLPHRGGRTPLEQSARSVPLPERSGARHRCAAGDHRAACLDVGAGVQQGVQHGDVVTARSPVQRCLGVRAGEPAIHIRPSGDQRGHAVRAVGQVPGPVGDDVQQGSAHAAPTFRPEVCSRQLGVLGEQFPQPRDVAGLDRLDSCDGARIVRWQEHDADSRARYRTSAGTATP